MRTVIVLLIICGINVHIYAHVRTNINEVTDLFDRNIEDKEGLFKEMRGQNENAISLIGSKQAVGMTPGMDEVETEVSKLNSIKEIDFDSSGRSKRASEEFRFYDENKLEPDYTKSGNRLHKRDADDIAHASGELMGDLMKKLKELNIDCKTVKGPVVIEPTYYIDLKREEQRNTDYDQFFCEEPRNKYNCNDSVSLTCTKKGIGFGEWQSKTIRFPGHSLHNEKMNWGWAVKWKNKRWGWHITPNHQQVSGETQIDSIWKNNPGAIIADARAYIAFKLSVSIEQIGEHVGFPGGGRGIGNINEGFPRWRVVWDEYEFSYQFREAFDICEVWKEDWTERCVLQ